MDLYKEILKILKEEIGSLKVAYAAPNLPLRSGDSFPSGISTKSSFLEDYVHQIVFKNKVQGEKTHYYIIYRKINKQEYDSLKNNYSISAAIIPTDIEEHSKDVYYTSNKSSKTGDSKSDANSNRVNNLIREFRDKKFVYLTKQEADQYNKDLPEDYKLTIVPTKDIYEKGIGVRKAKMENYIEYVKSYIERKDKKDKTPAAEKNTKTKKEISSEFFLQDDIIKYIKNIKSSFGKRFSLDIGSEERSASLEKYKEIREKLFYEIKKLIDSVSTGKIEFEELVLDTLEKKLESEKLYNSFIKYYTDNKGSSTEEPKKPEDTIDKKSKEEEPSKSVEKNKGDFLSKKENLSALRNIIQLYSDSIDDSNDKESKELFKKQYYDKMINLVSSIVLKEKNTEKAIKDISDYIKNFTENPDLYNRFKVIYDKMMSQIKSRTINEESTPGKKDYVVVTTVGGSADKLYGSNKRKRELKPGVYILSLDPTQVRNITNASRNPKISGILELITPEEWKSRGGSTSTKSTDKDKEDKLSGYRSMSGKIKQTKDYVTFDPTDPKDVERLKKTVGAVKTGEVLYSVNLKYEGGKQSEDTMLTLDQIKKIVGSDFKMVANTPQPFEIKKIKGVAPISGRKIYDEIKGVLKLNSITPIGPEKSKSSSNLSPVQYFVINRDNKKVVKGFATEKEADDFVKGMGSEYISVNKINLPKYGINLSRKNENLNEELTDQDIKSIISKKVSFTVETGGDKDSIASVSGKVTNVSYDKNKKEISLTLVDNEESKKNKESKVKFNMAGQKLVGVFDLNPLDNFGTVVKVNNITDKDFRKYLDKIFPPVEESKLESYIRKRIKKALKEAEIDQYIGGQGPEVKKKRLKEYMMKYEWGFQKSEDPFVRRTGSEKHAIVSKLVNELGDEGVAIFNSYAPEGMEISSPNDLADMADTPLGSQLHQPYDPNSLTGGDRIAEIEYTGQGEDEKDLIRVSDPDQTPSNSILVRDIKKRKDPEDAKYLIDIFRKTNKISDKVTDQKIYNTIKSIK